MPFRFDHEKAQHTILFLIHSLGGSTDISKLFLLLYLADLKHLATYGSLILGDSYIAMKYGPVPFNILGVFRQLEQGVVKAKRKTYLSIDDKKHVVAIVPYNILLLASSEVECMFEVIRQYKDLPFESLSEATKDKAWTGANINGDISLMDMAVASGASAEMIGYIEQSYRNEINSFNQRYETQ